MKTGYTKNAGYCLVTSSKRDNMRLITVVLGTKSSDARAQESQKLLNFGFRFYETHTLYEFNSPIKQVALYKGKKKTLRKRKVFFITLGLFINNNSISILWR